MLKRRRRRNTQNLMFKKTSPPGTNQATGEERKNLNKLERKEQTGTYGFNTTIAREDIIT